MVYVGTNSDNKYKFRQFFLKRNLEVPNCALHGLLVDRKSEADRQGPALPQLQKILCRLSGRRCYFFENSIS